MGDDERQGFGGDARVRVCRWGFAAQDALAEKPVGDLDRRQALSLVAALLATLGSEVAAGCLARALDLLGEDVGIFGGYIGVELVGDGCAVGNIGGSGGGSEGACGVQKAQAR
jgi:hypothetical protein